MTCGWSGRTVFTAISAATRGLRPARGQPGPKCGFAATPAAHALIVSLGNGGDNACSFVVGHLAYQRHEAQTIAVSGGQSVEWPVRLPREHGWYDIRVTVAGAAACTWRYAGRLENGRHSISDPALGQQNGRSIAPVIVSPFQGGESGWGHAAA